MKCMSGETQISRKFLLESRIWSSCGPFVTVLQIRGDSRDNLG